MNLKINRIIYRLSNLYIKIRNQLILWHHRRKFLIRFEVRNKIPRFIVPERYEKSVKWTLRILTAISILSSIFTLAWYISLPLSVLLCIIELLLEKTAFHFITLFIQPIPEWDDEQWLGMIFWQIENIRNAGMLFKTEYQARKVFECIRSWNYDFNVDSNNNIVVSFIIENDCTYSAYIYPSFERKVIKKFKEDIDYEMFKKERKIKEQQQIIVSIIICKSFPYQTNSGIHLFASNYRSGEPYYFGAYFLEDREPEINVNQPFRIRRNINEIASMTVAKPVLKFHLKIKERKELTSKDVEYHHGRLLMGK